MKYSTMTQFREKIEKADSIAEKATKLAEIYKMVDTFNSKEEINILVDNFTIELKGEEAKKAIEALRDKGMNLEIELGIRRQGE